MPGRAWRSPLRNDHVTLDRIDLDAPVLEPPDPALEHAFVALELEHHPSVVGLHVGAADVDHDVEVLHEPVDDRFLRSEEHTSELQSPCNLVCRLLLEKKKNATVHGLLCLAQ